MLMRVEQSTLFLWGEFVVQYLSRVTKGVNGVSEAQTN